MKQPTFWILSMMSLAAASDECQESQGEVPVSKAGVAMLVKGNFASSATAGASEKVVNNHRIEREAGLVSSLLKSSEISDSMVKELASMRITPEVKEFIEGTLQTLQPVFEAILAASGNDTKARDDMLKEFKDLESYLTDAAQKASIAEGHANTTRTEHMTCRGEQLTLWTALQSCRAKETELEGTMNDAKGVLVDKTATLKSLLCHDDNVTKNLEARIAAAVPYAQAGQDFLDAKEAYDAKVIECNAKESEYNNKTTACNNEQGTFEGHMCAIGEETKIGCGSYDTAYGIRKQDYMTFADEVERNSKKRVFEWTHLNRVGCALEFLKSHKVENHEVLERDIKACSTKPYLKPELVIARKDPPPKSPCLVLPSLPCSSAFLSKEYGELKEGQKAIACRPCQV